MLDSPHKCLEALGVVQKEIDKFVLVLNQWKSELVPSQTEIVGLGMGFKRPGLHLPLDFQTKTQKS